MTIRRAVRGDAALLARHRAEVWTEVGEWTRDELAGVLPQWVAFFADTLADGTCVAWIAEENDDPIASGALLRQPAIPRPGSSSRHEGRVHSVYVEPAFRRRGVAQAIMDELVRHARETGVIRLKLHPSDLARPLYRKMGFVDLDEMGLQLIED